MADPIKLPPGAVLLDDNDQPVAPPQQLGPTRAAAAALPQEDSDPLDQWLKSNDWTRPVMEFFEGPTPQQMGPGGSVPTETTAGQGFFERLKTLGRSAVANTAAGIRATPRLAYDFARSDFDYDTGGTPLNP